MSNTITEEQIEEQRERAREKRKEREARERKEREANQIQDVIDGVGMSTDVTLARYFDTTRKTIWAWARDPDNKFPSPYKVGPNMTRWSNAEIKAHRDNELLGALYA